MSAKNDATARKRGHGRQSDWPRLLVYLAAAGLVVIAFVGGRVSIGQEGLEINTGGFAEYLLKAEARKAELTPNSRQNDNRSARQGDRQSPQDLSTKELQKQVTEIAGRLPIATLIWVDDSPLSNQSERLAFSNLGIFVDAYTSNDEALRAFAWSSASYDAIISDVGRQVGTEDGMELLAAIRKENASIPFIFYTWDATEAIREQAKRLRATAVVESPDELASVLLKVLHEASMKPISALR